MKKFKFFAALLLLAFLAACGGGNSSNGGTANSTNSASGNGATKSSTSSSSAATGGARLADPKGSIEYQFELVKAGDYETLKSCCFTERTRGNLTKEIVDQAKGAASSYTMDDLYASAEDGEMDGKRTKKVKMKNGRTLTTLVETDGKWLADTIWFK